MWGTVRLEGCPGNAQVLRDYFLGHACVLSCLSCPTLCDPMDYSLPGSSVHGILQERILEWVAFSSPWDLPSAGIKPGSPALQADSFPPEHLGLA